MELIQVESSNIQAIGYDAETKVLRVEFKGGRQYEYAGVSPGIHTVLMGAESKGGFLALSIKPFCEVTKRVPAYITCDKCEELVKLPEDWPIDNCQLCLGPLRPVYQEEAEKDMEVKS